jgi:hypothetical protein
MATPDLRPMSLGELLDRSFSLYRSHFWTFVGIMAVPQLLILLAGLITTPITQEISTTGSSGAIAAAGALLLGALIMLVAYLVTYGAAQAATTFAVSELYLGRSTNVRQAYARVRGKVGRTVALFFLIYLLIMGGLILFIIPGIWVGLRTCVAIPAAMLENLTPSASVRRSIRLTERSAGRAFLVFVLMIFIAWVASLLFELPIGILSVAYQKQPGALLLLSQLRHIGTFLAGTLVGPVGSIALVLLYYDQRVRKEAFDLELMMANLDQTPASPSAAPA